MKCEKSKILIQLSADGELSSAEIRELESHLTQCLACRREAAWLDALFAQFPKTPTPPTHLEDAIVLRMNELFDKPQLVPETEIVAEYKASKKKPRKTKKNLLLRFMGRKKRSSRPRQPNWIVETTENSLSGLQAVSNAMTPALRGSFQAISWIGDTSRELGLVR